MYPICDQQNVQYFEQFASKASKFLSLYAWILDAYVSDFFYKHHWDRLPEAWRESLSCLITAELSTCLLDREVNGCTRHVLPLSLLCFKACTQAFSLDRRCHTDLEGVLHSLFTPGGNDDQGTIRDNQTDMRGSADQDIIGDSNPQVKKDEALLWKSDKPVLKSQKEMKRSLDPAVSAHDGSLHCFFKKHVKPKKQHEILELGKVINLLSEHVGCGHVVDVGAGLGHLSRLLSFGYGLGVTSVEASGTHAPKASKFDREVDREIKKKYMKMQDASSAGSTHTYPATASTLPNHVTSMIEPNMSTNDFLTIIRSQQQSERGISREPEFSREQDQNEHKNNSVGSASHKDNTHRHSPDSCSHKLVIHGNSADTKHDTEQTSHMCANIAVDTSNHDDHIIEPETVQRPHCCDSSTGNIRIDDVNAHHGRKRRDSETMCEIEPKSPKLEKSFSFDSSKLKFEPCDNGSEGDEELKKSSHIYGGNRSAQVSELQQDTGIGLCERDEIDTIVNVTTHTDMRTEPVHEGTTVTVTTHTDMRAEPVHEGTTVDDDIRTDGTDSGRDSSFILTGLHACGDLTPTFLRFFLNCEAAKGLASVGCCYMKLSTDGSGETVGYPMSTHVASLPDYQLSFNALELACHFADTYANRLKECAPHLKIHSYRAALEWLANQISPTFQRSSIQIPAKKTNKMDFKTYACVGLTKLGLPVDEMGSELLARAELMTERWRDVVAFYTLRLSLAPVVESLVLIDRMLYLYENGLDSALVPIFDPGLSPRNCVLLSGKQAGFGRIDTHKLHRSIDK